MRDKTRALIEAKAVEQCKARKPLDWTVEETEAFKAGAEAMEALMLGREEKLVAALITYGKHLSACSWKSPGSECDCGFYAVLEHHAAKGEV